MHDRLFAHQKALEPWSGHAEALGLDVAAFEACMGSGKHSAAIRKDIAAASSVGITSTPNFVLGRTEPGSSKIRVVASLQGAKPFAAFKAEIDRLLAEADTPAAGGASR